MKSHFNRLVPSFIVALSFAASQASWGMIEDDQKNNKLKFLQNKSKDDDFINIPEYIKTQVRKLMPDKENTEFHTFKLACNTWQKILKEQDPEREIKKLLIKKHDGEIKKLLIKKHYSITTTQDEETFEKLWKGKLIYTDPKTKQQTELLIADLKDPLNGEFDLSKCGKAQKQLRFKMGVPTENDTNTFSILFAPRFCIEKELNNRTKELLHLKSLMCEETAKLRFREKYGRTTKYFEEIMKHWDTNQAPVAVFCSDYRLDDLAWYDYLIPTTLSELGNDNLYKKCGTAIEGRNRIHYLGERGPRCTGRDPYILKNFTFRL